MIGENMQTISKRIIVAVLLFVSADAIAAEKVAVIKETAHACKMLRSSCQIISSGDEIYEGDVIQTGKDGYAGLSFNDGTTVALDSDSKFQINKYDYTPLKHSYSFDVLLSRGAALYSSGRLGKLDPAAVKFKTPTTVIAVRGTRFLVSTD